MTDPTRLEPTVPPGASWSLTQLGLDDAPTLADIRVAAMRPSLEAAGVWDEQWARQRFYRDFDPSVAWGIVQDGRLIGCIALRTEGDVYWLEHFLIRPGHHGAGIGSQVLQAVLDAAGPGLVKLSVIDGSPAERLYRRFGFRRTRQDGVVVYLERPAEPRPT